LSAGASASEKEESSATPERRKGELAAKSSFAAEGSVESADGEAKDKETVSRRSERIKPTAIGGAEAEEGNKT
jgi:hypothetical protein